MRYNNIKFGKFISRPNRFIAHVDVDGDNVVCHVKNTGRCRELLIEGATVILEKSDNPARKTAYDLVSVYKGDVLVNIDSQAPNAVFKEWLNTTDYFGKLTLVKPEHTFGNSRFDFYLETEKRKAFVEVKGVTLERKGVAMFPDAPTDRGAKHLKELVYAKEAGYDAYIFFVIQMKGCKSFKPNAETDPDFAKALKEAENVGVKVCVVDCFVNVDELKIDDFLNF